jgi:hypothetical protein
MACLAKESDERPESAAEVARLLADMDEAATVSLVLTDTPEDPQVADLPDPADAVRAVRVRAADPDRTVN